MKPEDYIPIIVSVFSLIIALVTYILTRSQLNLAKRVFNSDHEHNRRQTALDLLTRWDSDTLEARKHVMAKWADYFYNSNKIPWNEIKELRDKQIEEYRNIGNVTSHHLVTDHMATILNYFDLIAVAVLNNIANKTILEHAIKKTFQRWYFILNDYRKTVNEQRKYHPWTMAEKLYREEWLPDNGSETLEPIEKSKTI